VTVIEVDDEEEEDEDDEKDEEDEEEDAHDDQIGVGVADVKVNGGTASTMREPCIRAANHRRGEEEASAAIVVSSTIVNVKGATRIEEFFCGMFSRTRHDMDVSRRSPDGKCMSAEVRHVRLFYYRQRPLSPR